MTGAATITAAPAQTLPRRLTSLVRHAPERLREREFWTIQAGVLAVTAIHVLGEWWSDQLLPGIHPALHHVPVILYLAPIAYASLRYGIEGAVLTGLWAALLTMPNIIIWHSQGLEWLTELVYVAVVVAAGIVMAVPVERERRQRRHAEATTRRVRLLNDVATLTLTADLDDTLHETLGMLVTVLRLDGACLGATDLDAPDSLSVLAHHPPEHDEALTACVAGLTPPDGGGWLHQTEPNVIAITFATELPEPGPVGRVAGVLAVKVNPATPLTEDEHELLVGVSNQLAIGLANARLTALEHDRVRSYARQVTWAQEEERKRISRELHDEAAQNLVAVRRQLDTVTSTGAAREDPDLHRLHALTAQTLEALRRFSRDLRPPVLDDLGLVSALESLVNDTRSRSDVEVDLTITGSPHRLGAETELALFRIAQSALHNVERHAQATHAVIELAFCADRTRLTVSDDGRGFEPPGSLAELVHAGKLGLIGMHERAQLVGGELEISRTDEGGARIEVHVPR